jgi:hypothetical protein
MAEKGAARRASTAGHRDEPALQEVSVDPSGASYSSESCAPLVPRRETVRYWCPACGVRALDFTQRPHRDGGWTVLVHCFACHGGLDAISAAIDVPRSRLLKWPPPGELGSAVGTTSRRDKANEPPPTEGAVAGWRSALFASSDALRYLIEKRGLTLETIERYELGYHRAGNAVTFPVRDERGGLVNVKRRFLNRSAQPKSMGLARPAALYPVQVLAGDPRALVVCEGEVDALLLNQYGIPAVTSTAGTHWNRAWDTHIACRHVAVLYDAGAVSYEKAEARALAFRSAGAVNAWPVDLMLAGFDKSEDVGDWFVTYGRSADELRRYIWASRRRYRRDRRSA